MASDITTELRGPCAKHIVDVLDAISMSKRMSRTDLINEILLAYVEARLHETSLLVSIARGNPELADKIGIERK
jgi:hypothetical protein